MPKDFLQGARDDYDCVVIGSGLAGLTAANTLARSGRSVLLLEQHYKLGGMATWFKRPGGHIFDISLHGFPVGMIKSCRRYWTREIADSIVQLKNIRFDNPMFSLTTTFDREDFTRLLVERFAVPAASGDGIFRRGAGHELLRRPVAPPSASCSSGSFPAARTSMRLLMEPITYANGSTLEDPAITYGIVFSNFMSKGVYTFQGGTDRLIRLMHEELIAQRRRRPHPLRRRHDRRSRRPRDGRRGRRPHDRLLGRRLERESQVDHFQARRRGAFRPGICRRSPGRAAQQFELPGLHGAQAGRRA